MALRAIGRQIGTNAVFEADAVVRGGGQCREEMQAGGLQTDLVDNKVCSVTSKDYGTRFVIRKEHRSRYA